jgi:peptidoglycan hydrolase-like protein with peptidoglycan-binding domain
MRWVLSLAFLGTATLAAGASLDQTKPRSKSASTKRIPVATKTVGTTSSKSFRSTRGGKVRGRGSASTRTLRVSPPSYQLHPDPERYQQIQQALAERGYFKGEINGTWGEDSIEALRKFQADQNLPDDGKITALSLTGLGLGPRHDGSTAGTVPVQPPPPDSAIPTAITPQTEEPPRLPY